jgi:FkbM family methyltransferase
MLQGALRRYERAEAAVIVERLEPDDVVVELGGGIGFTSALCAKRISSADVHVYEADPRLQGPIEDLYRLNDVAPDLHMYALGPSEGRMDFYLAEDFWASSSLPPSVPAQSRISIQVKAFEQEIARYPRRPNFLIIDIEGGEFDFLHRVPLTGIEKLLCEVHPDVLGAERVHRLRDYLRVKGFERDDALGSDMVWYLERGASVQG